MTMALLRDEQPRNADLGLVLAAVAEATIDNDLPVVVAAQASLEDLAGAVPEHMDWASSWTARIHTALMMTEIIRFIYALPHHEWRSEAGLR